MYVSTYISYVLIQNMYTMYLHLCMYICVCINVSIYIYLYIYIYISLCLSKEVLSTVSVFITSIFPLYGICIFMYKIYTCMYVYTYLHRYV